MKKKTKKARLTLDRTTLRSLDTRRLAHVAGGQSWNICVGAHIATGVKN